MDVVTRGRWCKRDAEDRVRGGKGFRIAPSKGSNTDGKAKGKNVEYSHFPTKTSIRCSHLTMNLFHEV